MLSGCMHEAPPNSNSQSAIREATALRQGGCGTGPVAAFAEGTPSHDQFGNLFAALNAEAFQGCFIGWVASLTKLGPEIVAIDGKTLRRSYQEGGAKAPIHMISAFSSRQRMVLGQRKVDDKSNEITAIPELLDLLTVKGAIVTIDAMGCQKDIAAKIIDKGAYYLLALKGNQGSLRDDVELFFTDQKERGFADAAMSRHQTPAAIPGSHSGRPGYVPQSCIARVVPILVAAGNDPRSLFGRASFGKTAHPFLGSTLRTLFTIATLGYRRVGEP